MPSYRMAKPSKSIKVDHEQRFIEVVELSTADLSHYAGEPWERLFAAAQLGKSITRGYNETQADVKRVEYFKLTECPPPGKSWLRDERGTAVLYRQN